MIKFLRLLWDFGRPHTLIGSTLSILTLYLLASEKYLAVQFLDLFILALLAALGCNLFITGLNQIVDVEMDKINKPFLPIAAGRLSVKKAYIIIYVALLLSVAISFYIDVCYFLLIGVILLIGVAYSVPPLRLKKHHLPASLSIVLVRGLLVNLGIGVFFEYYMYGIWRSGTVLIPLTIFMMAFSFAIAWFKDLYDVEGDQQFEVKTLAVLYSIPTAYVLGNTMILLAYLFNILYALYTEVDHAGILIWGHSLLLVAYVGLLLKSRVENRQGIYTFYMSIWIFFFLEYILFIVYALQ